MALEEMIAAYSSRVAMRSLWKVQAHNWKQETKGDQGPRGNVETWKPETWKPQDFPRLYIQKAARLDLMKI